MTGEKTISKEDVIELYKLNNGEEPSWADKPFSQMAKEERNEYQKFRKQIEKERKNKINEEKPSTPENEGAALQNEGEEEAVIGYENTDEKTFEEYATVDPVPEGYYTEEGEMSDEEKLNLVSHTTRKAAEDLLTPEQKEVLEKQREQDEIISKYIEHHQIKDQAHLNYAIEHDEKFRLYLEKTGRLKELYSGKHLKEIREELEKVKKELEEEAKKDKGKKTAKKFEKKTSSNNFKDAVKSLDLTPYRNKKLESQGFILCMYLRKNGLMDLRYVKMDEVGQIKVDGYVYHERDATYRFGKKNDPVLVIMEGALVPLNKETLKENLGFKSAEAQKLIIKGIEQAEVVKAAGIDENAKKPFTPPKWLIIIGIAVVIGIYAYMGGFS